MKTLAKAKPNRKYRWYQNIKDITLEARTNGVKIFYYSVEPGKEFRIGENVTKNFFREDRLRLKDKQFLRKENRLFYEILFRNRQRYRESYLEFIKELDERG